MKSKKIFLCLAWIFMISNAPISAEDKIIHKWTLKTSLDFGHIVNGSIPEKYAKSINIPSDVRMLPLNRANVLMIQHVTLNNFDVSAGLAALVWWPYGGGVTDASERVRNVKPLVPVARARWQFGDKETTHGFLQVGTFSYKYNPDAKNLGEYLYRGGTYPGFLWTNEGWLLMNRAGNYSHGLLFGMSHLGGMFKHNLSLFMEMVYYPIGDFSPGYDFSLNTKWLEVGGGLVFNHYLPLRPSLLKPESDENIYVHATVNDTSHYYGPRNLLPFGDFDTFNPTFREKTLHRWSHKGIKLMARAALNLNHLLPEGAKSPEDLRLFAEIAVLGWEDRPLYYENRSQRMPIMFGINIPTFGFLDVLTLQVEHYSSPFNDINDFNTRSLPVWVADLTDFDSTSFTEQPRLDPSGKIIPLENHDDDFKWNIYAKKEINKIMTVFAQAGSDHFRLTDGKFKASSVPLTTRPSEWYYLLRFDFLLW